MRGDGGVRAGAFLVQAQLGFHHEVAQQQLEELLAPMVIHQPLDLFEEAGRVPHDVGVLEVDPLLADLHAGHDAGDAAGVVGRDAPALKVGDHRALEIAARGADRNGVATQAVPVVAHDLLFGRR